MTSHERIRRMFDHQEADRVPITDGPWSSTWERWHREGLPEAVSMAEYFDIDRVESIFPDTSPQFPGKLVEETDEYRIATTPWGATLKNWKHHGGVPEFLDFTIVDWDSWNQAKLRMAPSPDRIDWAHLKREYPEWRRSGAWVQGHLWFGFDVTHSWTIGTDRTLFALADEPEWLMDIFGTMLDSSIAHFEMILAEGYAIDEVFWPDDMGYKGHQFFSVPMYRELLKPYHAKAAEWARSKGIRVHMHSCGDVRPFVPELIEIGVEMLNPIEVKAGMNPVELKGLYGDRLGFHGGLNAVLFGDMAKMQEEMRRVVPVMKKGGGYWISSDHSVPDSVSLSEFKQFVELAKELGSYA